MASKQTANPGSNEVAEKDTPKIRPCLSCRTPFESAWSGERVCKRCKSSKLWQNGAMHSNFSTRRR